MLLQRFLAGQAALGGRLDPQAAQGDVAAALGAQAEAATGDARQCLVDRLQVGQLDLQLANFGIGHQISLSLFAHFGKMIGQGQFARVARLVHMLADGIERGCAQALQLPLEQHDVIVGDFWQF